MGLIFMLLKKLFKLSLYFLIFSAIIILIPNLPPYTTFSSINLEPTLPRVGPLAPNNVLNNAEKAYVDKVLGPEAFQVYKNELYTSLATGEIVKLSPGGHVTFVTKIGQPCSGLIHEHICGRPLGFQIDENTNLMYVVDAYYGIWKVGLKNDKKQLLVAPNVAIEGRVPKLFNSIALAKNGDFYWTDSNTDFQLKDGAMTALTDPSGRLLHYNAATNTSKVLLDNLWFANGLAISPDNQFVIVAETYSSRLMKYYIDGPKKGKSEPFVVGLPGMPDNVRALPDGSGVLIGLYSGFDEHNPMLTRSMAAAPLARKLVARLQKLIELPFEYLNTIYPHVLLEEVVYYIGHFKSVSGLVPKITGLVQVDWNGNIVASYLNTDGSVQHVSDAIVFNDRLYTGNPHGQNFVGSLPAPPLLKKAFQLKAGLPKLSKPVVTPQPKSDQKPKVEVKPKPKVEEQPQIKVAEKSKVDVKREAPKPAVVQEKPSETQQAKPVETVKPTPKLHDKMAPKPTEAPQPAQQQATPPPIKIGPPKVQSKSETKPTPKAETQPKVGPRVVPTTASKPVEKTAPPPARTTQEVKSTTVKPEVKPKPAQTMPDNVAKPTQSQQKPVKDKGPEQIPIREEIPSDTAKPTKDTLKVIKKGGPAVIPNPNQ